MPPPPPYPVLPEGRLKKVRVNRRPCILDTETGQVSAFWNDQTTLRNNYMDLMMAGRYPTTILHNWTSDHSTIMEGEDYDDGDYDEEDYYDDEDDEDDGRW